MTESRASPITLSEPAPKRQKISPLPIASDNDDFTITFSELEPGIIARLHYELGVDINSPYTLLTEAGKAALIGHLHEKDEHIRRLAYLECCRSSPTWEGRTTWIREELRRRAPGMMGEFYRRFEPILPPKKGTQRGKGKDGMRDGEGRGKQYKTLLAKATANSAAKPAVTGSVKMLLESAGKSSWPGGAQLTAVSSVKPPMASPPQHATQNAAKQELDFEITAVRNLKPATSTPKTGVRDEVKITPNPKIQVLVPNYTPPPKSSIIIRLKYSRTESMPFRMKRTTIFSHLMNQALKKLGVEMHREFTFKGKLLQPKATPIEVRKATSMQYSKRMRMQMLILS